MIKRVGDIALTAAITAVVTTFVDNAIEDWSAAGRIWREVREAFMVFADGAAPVLAWVGGVILILWLGLWLLLLVKQQRTDTLDVDPHLPNPMTVLACVAVLALAAAYSLGRAASGSDVAAVAACCVGAVALRASFRLVADVRRTLFGTPF